MARDHDDWFACPNCGEQVRAGALACPACGADDQTGWSDEAEYDGLDLPGDDWAGDRPRGPRWPRAVSFLFAVLLIVALLWLMTAGLG